MAQTCDWTIMENAHGIREHRARYLGRLLMVRLEQEKETRRYRYIAYDVRNGTGGDVSIGHSATLNSAKTKAIKWAQHGPEIAPVQQPKVEEPPPAEPVAPRPRLVLTGALTFTIQGMVQITNIEQEQSVLDSLELIVHTMKEHGCEVTCDIESDRKLKL